MKNTWIAIFVMAVVSACSSTPCEDWCDKNSNCSGGSFEAGGDSCADSCESASENFHNMGEACGDAFDAYIVCGGSSRCDMMSSDCSAEDQKFTNTCIAAQ